MSSDFPPPLNFNAQHASFRPRMDAPEHGSAGTRCQRNHESRKTRKNVSFTSSFSLFYQVLFLYL